CARDGRSVEDGMKNPRLLFISGVLKRTLVQIPLSGDEVTLGRDTDNNVCIPDPLASGRHFAVRWQNGRAVLYDRKTRNGTWIDQKYYINKELQHGDRIICGGTVIIYLEDEDALDAIVNLEDEVEAEGYRQQKVATLRVDYSVRGEAAIYYKDVLNLLENVSKSRDTLEDRDQLLTHLLNLNFSAIPARRGAILLNGPRMGAAESDFETKVFCERDYNGPQRFFFSSVDSAALEWVYGKRMGYITNKPIPVLC